MAVSNCVSVARKVINKHPILAVTSIVTPGQNDTFQLLFDEFSVLALKPLWHFKTEKTQLLAALVAKATQPQLTRRTLMVLVNADSLLNLKGARKNTVLLCLSLVQKKNK